jgi:hypothetical protein
MRPNLDHLEARALLSTTPFVAQPTFQLVPMGGGMSPQSSPYTPAQIAKAYQFTSISFNGVAGTGAGETIAIVDAYDDPNIQSDLNTFDTRFSLPATTVVRVNQTGGTAYPATDRSGGWEVEESLDVEWAHAMAPRATIMLVEANSDNGNDLIAAVGYAATHASVVSMSWGGGEWSGEASYDADFDQPGVAFVASSGDSGAPSGWPSVSINVLSIGGTALYLNSNNNWSSEAGWGGSGGGPSIYESQPSFQKGVVTQTSSARATPDVAYDASPSTGVYVYDSFGAGGWLDVGGTSAGSPQWSAILAIADQGRALSGQPLLNSSSPQEVMSILYKNPAAFHDITTGTSNGSPQYSARAGYDYVTGLGSPIANLVVSALVGSTSTPPSPPPAPPSPTSDKLVLTGPATESAGKSFSLTVTAQTSSGATDTGYLGTIRFTSSDPQAGLPANFTFTAANHGTYTFTVTFKTAGTQSVTATDNSNSSITGTLYGTVSPAAPSQFVISGIPSSVPPDTAQSFTVTAADPYGNLATGYTGTVQFSSSDPAANLPANYTFSVANQGAQSFSLTFNTAGTQSVTVKDINSGISGTDSGISVGLAAPANLAAIAVSTSQVNLMWTGSRGATGYVIQESLNSGAGWAQIGTTSGSTTSFSQTGLTAGTTYYYRVAATVGSFESAFSNIASATTGTTKTPGDSIWTNSYVPVENSSNAGSFELGVKFEASVSGNVIGVRFYKETAMGGYVHVGHLWSSTGQLLATATFTNESASGWQQVAFSSPVKIQAFTVYIASFSTGGGNYGITTNFFNSSGVINGPLQALANGVPGGDGVYAKAGNFPSVSGNGTNFWADVAFNPSNGGVILDGISRPTDSNDPGGFAIGLLSTGESSHALPSAQAAAPAAPVAPPRYVTAARGTVPTVLGSWSNRTLVPQAATSVSLLTATRGDFLGAD